MMFKDVTSNWITWYDLLKKPNKGFIFDQKASLTSYIDAAMTEIHGDPEENELWTRENLRDLKRSASGGPDPDPVVPVFKRGERDTVIKRCTWSTTTNKSNANFRKDLTVGTDWGSLRAGRTTRCARCS